MNIELFKEEIQKIDLYDLKLKYIRNFIQNSAEEMFRSKLLDECEIRVPYEEWSDEEREEFDDKWDYICSTGIVDLYNEIGLSISPLYSKKHIKMSVLVDLPYYYFGFSDVWNTIKELNNEEFCYAMIILSKNISQTSKLYHYIVKPTQLAIEKFGFSEMKKLFKVKEKPYAFIAMWFDQSMEKTKIVIKEAVESCGFEAKTIDMKEHNNQIVPEIFFEIKNSAFVIADLTGHRGGVYYEAGYAQALGKEVIHSCHSDSFGDLHFDISQKNTIKWFNNYDLKNKLISRIKATVTEIF